MLIEDAIGGSEECKDMIDEVVLGVGQPGPVRKVCQKADLFCHPEISFGFIVHPPDVSMVDGEEYKAVWMFLQKRFRSKESFVFANLVF